MDLESSSTSTGLEAPAQQCPSNWEMERTTVDGCSLVVGSLDLGETLFSLEEFFTGTQADRQASTSSSKTLCPQMNRKPGDNELANEKNKQFGPGEKREESPF